MPDESGNDAEVALVMFLGVIQEDLVGQMLKRTEDGDSVSDQHRSQRSQSILANMSGARVPAKRPRDPAMTLTTALVVYIFINLILALPLVIFPVTYFKVIGLPDTIADQLGGLRWVGAVLLAWSMTAIAVMARPSGRGVFRHRWGHPIDHRRSLGFLYSLSLR